MLGLLDMRNSSASLSEALQAMRRRMRHAFERIKFFSRQEEGVSAIEFAILTPFLVAAILALGLISVLIDHRIKMDQVLRAGAAIAISDPGAAAVAQRMREVALSKGYSSINTTPGTVPGVLHMQSVRSCFCPEAPNGNLGCNAICFNQRPVVVRYILEAGYRDPLTYRFNDIMRRIRLNFVIAYTDPFVRTQVVVR